MREVLKKFGRYFLLDQIAQGGMAEIYRARDANGDGPVRLFAIKRILSHHGRDTEYLKMFQSEIEVTANFSHPNLVTVINHGVEVGDPFIAMEYVDGRSIRQMTSRCAENKKTIPMEAAAMIALQAAAGLHYAHTFKDKISGEALNVVHRDISPQNVLVSYDGTVKIIDFGIAKASTNAEATRAGLIKGKPSYLSPEQVTGERLDGRCDLFALGIVLWEMLVGRKLFVGENDLAILKMIESAQTHVKPPSNFNSSVPKELDAIVMKALAKRREERYQTGEEMSIALNRFLRVAAPEYLHNDLSVYLRELFKTEILEDRKRLQKMNEQAEQLLVLNQVTRDVISEVYPETRTDTRPNPVATPIVPKEGTTMVGRGRGAPATPPAASTPAQPAQPTPTPPAGVTLPPSRGTQGVRSVELEAASRGSYSGSIGSRSRPSITQPEVFAPMGRNRTRSIQIQAPPKPTPAKWMAVAAGVAAVLYFGRGFMAAREESSPGVVALNPATLTLNGNLKGVSVTLNGQEVGNALPLTLPDVPSGSPIRVFVGSEAGNFEQELTLTQGENRTIDVKLQAARVQPQSAGGQMVQLRLNLIGASGLASITVNGRQVDSHNPAIQVPLNEPLELVVDKEGFRRLQRQFVLDSREVEAIVRERGEYAMDVPMEPVKFGYLTIHSTPSASVQFVQDGRVITPGDGSRAPAETVRTPVENIRLPIGVYNIRMTNDVLGMEKIVTISIEDGRSRVIDERLEIKN